jgi:predicted DCC family thiol-disulfide oxidoreductase YuxK
MSAVRETRETWLLFYDASCNLCHQSMKRLKAWARSAGQPLEVHTLQGSLALQRGYRDEMVLEVDGQTYRAGEAWLEVMRIAPWYLRWVSLARQTRPTRWIAVTFYNFVAANRHKFLGRRQVGVPCPSGGG